VGRTILVKRITLFAVFYHTHVRLKGDENMMPPEPPIVNPNPLDFGPLPQGRSKTFQVLISNPSQKTLIWHADSGETSWLTLDKSIGTIPPGKQQPVNVMADTGSLASGDYAATLTFTSEGDNSSASVKVPITLTIPDVLPPAVGLSFSLFLASSKTLPLALTNRDNQIVNWTADTGGTNWLTLDRNKGTLQPHEVQTLYVTANSSSFLAFGDYPATLTFSSEAGGNKSADASLPVELHISLKPFSDDGPKAPIVTNLSRFDFNIQQVSGNLVITNPDDNPQVNWTMDTGGVNWVTLSPNNGSLQAGGQATINVTSNTSLLSSQAGNYRTDLRLTFTFDTAIDPTKVGHEPTSTLVPLTMTVP
jgi:hypothetical protein